METSDAELLTAWRARGDHAALEALLARHVPRIQRLLTHMASDPTTADDLTQEVFLRVTRKLSDFAAQAQFSTWLHRIALNVFYSHAQDVRRRHSAPFEAATQSNARVQDRPVEQAASREHVLLIEEALAELPAKRRVALVLVCLEGHSVEQVAEWEECPPQTIYSRLHEARRQLKARLKDLLP